MKHEVTIPLVRHQHECPMLAGQFQVIHIKVVESTDLATHHYELGLENSEMVMSAKLSLTMLTPGAALPQILDLVDAVIIPTWNTNRWEHEIVSMHIHDAHGLKRALKQAHTTLRSFPLGFNAASSAATFSSSSSG